MRIEQKLTRTWQHRIENSALVVLAHVQRAPQPLHCGKLLPAASPAADRRASEDDAEGGRPGSLHAGPPSRFPQLRADRLRPDFRKVRTKRPDFRNGDKDAEHVHAACVSADQTGFAALLDELRRDLGN